MQHKDMPEWMSGIETVVSDPNQFKIKLDIGEDAYKSLRMKKHLLDAVDAGNGVLAGMTVANSSVVASTFFAPSGILGAIGIGTAATPLGWAIAAGVVGAGMSVAIGKYVVRSNSSRVSVIPEFINTPLDILAVGLFDLIGMLSIKVALIDGDFSEAERDCIKSYFIKEWGFDEVFVDKGVGEIEKRSEHHTIKSVAQNLAELKKQNPDCNYKSMTREVIDFLNEVAASDDFIDEREEMAVERVERIFNAAGSFSLAYMGGNLKELLLRDLTADSASYVAVASGAKFHLAHCHAVRNRSLTKSWSVRKNALKDGLEPCRVCQP
jgi:hypothetical protein